MPASNSQRWSILKNLGLFQFKLMIDAFRDILLSPVAICCGLIDLLKNNSEEQSYLKKLMSVGHLSDQWLNLFSYRSAREEQSSQQSLVSQSTQQPLDASSAKTLDEVVDKLEDVLKEHMAKDSQSVKSLQAMQQQIKQVHQKLIKANKGRNDNEPNQ